MKYEFHDAKIWSLQFNFDSYCFDEPQQLVIDLDYCLESKWTNDILINTLAPCKLYFINVSSLKINLKSGYFVFPPTSYAADGLFVLDITNTKKVVDHEEWLIQMIDDVGQILIQCDSTHLNIFDEKKVEVEMEMFIPRNIRRNL